MDNQFEKVEEQTNIIVEKLLNQEMWDQLWIHRIEDCLDPNLFSNYYPRWKVSYRKHTEGKTKEITTEIYGKTRSNARETPAKHFDLCRIFHCGYHDTLDGRY